MRLGGAWAGVALTIVLGVLMALDWLGVSFVWVGDGQPKNRFCASVGGVWIVRWSSEFTYPNTPPYYPVGGGFTSYTFYDHRQGGWWYAPAFVRIGFEHQQVFQRLWWYWRWESWGFGVPTWGTVVIAGAASAMLGATLRKRRESWACGACGYSLVGLPGGAACPECGVVSAALPQTNKDRGPDTR